MQEFYIDVVLRRGLTRIQVDEVPPESWTLPATPQFIIEFHTGRGFLMLTVMLESGTWYDQNSKLSAEGDPLSYLKLDAVETLNPNYISPLSTEELKNIGSAISNHMLVSLTAYMALFIPQYPNPDLN